MRMIEDLVDNCDLSDYISHWFHLNPVPITYGMSTESIESRVQILQSGVYPHYPELFKRVLNEFSDRIKVWTLCRQANMFSPNATAQ